MFWQRQQVDYRPGLLADPPFAAKNIVGLAARRLASPRSFGGHGEGVGGLGRPNLVDVSRDVSCFGGSNQVVTAGVSFWPGLLRVVIGAPSIFLKQGTQAA